MSDQLPGDDVIEIQEDSRSRRRSPISRIIKFLFVLILLGAGVIFGSAYLVQSGFLPQSWNIAARLGLNLPGAQQTQIPLSPPEEPAETIPPPEVVEPTPEPVVTEPTPPPPPQEPAPEVTEALDAAMKERETLQKELAALDKKLRQLRQYSHNTRGQVRKITKNPAITLFNSKGEYHPALIPRPRPEDQITQWQILGINTERGEALVRSPEGESFTLRAGDIREDLGRIWGLNYDRQREKFIIYTDIGDLVSPAVPIDGVPP